MTALLALLLASPAFGVIVGHNGAIGDGRAELRFADDDAARMYELLAAGGVEAHLLTTFDADSQAIFPSLRTRATPPTMQRVEAVVAQVRAKVEAATARGERPEVYFFYSGHGNVAEGEGYVGLDGGRLRRRDLYRLIIDGMPAHRVHVIIDACKSYFLVGGRGPGGKATAYPNAFARPRAPAGVGYVLSTSADAESHEWAALPGGVFSHEVRSGLVGAADADGNGSVDYEELAAFIGLANRAVPLPRYRPRVYVRPPAADARAALFRPGSMTGVTALRIPPDAVGRLSVSDDRGLRYVDTHKAPAQDLKIALLAPRRYAIRWRDAQLDLTADGQPRQLADATPVPLTVASRSVAHRAFEHLFEVPFGSAVVDGYRLGVADAAPPAVEDDDTTALIWGASGTGLLIAAGALGYYALDAQIEARDAPQADRAGLNDRTLVLGWSSAGVAALGLTALGVSLYEALSD